MTTEYIRHRDSDGVEHYVDKQNEPMSCALASIGMMWDMSRQQCSVVDETGYKVISARYPGSLLYSQLIAALTGGNTNGTGTGISNINSTMQSVGLNVTTQDNFDTSKTAHNYGFSWRKSRVSVRKPALLGVYWKKRTASGLQSLGGHAIVAARITSKGYVVILDPWDAKLYELHGSQGYYQPSYASPGTFGRIGVALYTG
jgi:hypothetical protein